MGIFGSFRGIFYGRVYIVFRNRCNFVFGGLFWGWRESVSIVIRIYIYLYVYFCLFFYIRMFIYLRTFIFIFLCLYVYLSGE